MLGGGRLVRKVWPQVKTSVAQVLGDHDLNHAISRAIFYLSLLRDFFQKAKVEKKSPVLSISHRRNIMHTSSCLQYIANMLDSQLKAQYIACSNNKEVQDARGY